jgi:hypothetical protein
VCAARVSFETPLHTFLAESQTRHERSNTLLNGSCLSHCVNIVFVRARVMGFQRLDRYRSDVKVSVLIFKSAMRRKIRETIAFCVRALVVYNFSCEFVWAAARCVEITPSKTPLRLGSNNFE